MPLLIFGGPQKKSGTENTLIIVWVLSFAGRNLFFGKNNASNVINNYVVELITREAKDTQFKWLQ